MDLWQTVRILRRRWRVMALLAVVTLSGIATSLHEVRPRYLGRTTLILVMPARAEGSETAINPYLNFGSTLIVTGRVITAAMLQDSAAAALDQAGASADYTIKTDPMGQSPTLTIQVSDPDPAEVTQTLQKVVDATRKELADRQRAAGAPEASWIAAVDVTAPGKLAVERSEQFRIVAMVGGLGVVASLFAAFAAEGLRRRRT